MLRVRGTALSRGMGLELRSEIAGSLRVMVRHDAVGNVRGGEPYSKDGRSGRATTRGCETDPVTKLTKPGMKRNPEMETQRLRRRRGSD